MARTTDPVTSHLAAKKSAKGSCRTDRVVAWAFLENRERGLTDEELVDYCVNKLGLRRTPQAIRCGRVRLYRSNPDILYEAGQRNTRLGNPAIVYMMSDAGRPALRRIADGGVQ